MRDIPNGSIGPTSGVENEMRTTRRTVIAPIMLSLSETMARRALLLHPPSAPVEQAERRDNNYQYETEQQIAIHDEVRGRPKQLISGF